MSHSKTALILAAALAAALAVPSSVFAHCDTMEGPVVADAKLALEHRDVAPILKWVGPADEPAIRSAFDQTLAVRALGPEARELADRFFFETLVRIHRAAEGAPFTGLKPEGTEIEPIVLAADRALVSGSDAELVAHLTKAVADGARQRFASAAEARRHADQNPEMGRHYVAAYVELTHWLERLDHDATTDAHAGAEAPAAHSH
jgi:hypothetical protein